MNEAERTELRRRLLQYPNVTEQNVDQQIWAYEEREIEKNELIKRHYSNALAECFLDRKGYPRPPGLHSVFFYPGSYRPRNGVIFGLILIAGLIWYFSK